MTATGNMAGTGRVGGSVGKPTLCIVNYNGESFLEDTLAGALALRDCFSDILFVDGASEDRSVEIARETLPFGRIIELPENRGPSVARNVGLKEARSDLVLLVDNDVVLPRECVENLVAAMHRHPDAVAAMPRVCYAHNRTMIQYDGADNHFLGLMTLHNENVPVSSAPTDVRDIGSVVSAAVLVDRSRIAAAEPFDESFFIYFEDHDFGVRLRAQGKRILSVPSAVCYHGSGTVGLSIRSLGQYSRLRVFCLIRNRWQFILKNYSLRSLLLLSPALLMYELAQFITVVWKGWLGEWVRSVWWVIAHAPSTLEKRRAIQRARAEPDRRLMKSGPLPLRPELTSTRLERAGLNALSAASAFYWSLVRRAI